MFVPPSSGLNTLPSLQPLAYILPLHIKWILSLSYLSREKTYENITFYLYSASIKTTVS